MRHARCAPTVRTRRFHVTRSVAGAVLPCLLAIAGLIAGRPAHAAADEVAVAMQTPACPDGICSGLGHAFFLPGINGFDPPSTGNDFSVDARLGSCASLSPPDGSATRQFQNSESMEELTRKTSSSFELSGSYTTARLTARGSVSAMTGADTSSTQHMTSTPIDITTPTRTVDSNQRGRDCFAKDNVDPSHVQQLEALPLIHADRAGQQSEWDPYVIYLQRLGSHTIEAYRIPSTSVVARWCEHTLPGVRSAALESGCPELDSELDYPDALVLRPRKPIQRGTRSQ